MKGRGRPGHGHGHGHGRWLLVALALAALAAPVSAQAFYGEGAQIVSADFQRLEQGDDATSFAAISADGRYVAIQTRARNFFADDDPDPAGRYRAGGVFRFELATKRLQKVADGDLFDEASGSFLRRGASNPAISADGRYVAFASAEPLVPADLNDHVDVYVRDMDLPIGAAGAYDLVSARDGGDVPASYGEPSSPVPGSEPGSDLSRAVAISADGTTVAWTGANAGAQTRFLGGENPEPGFPYYLWRRIADGPSAPTRRITGLADPDDPGCPLGSNSNFDQTSTGPCFGPLTDQEANRTSISGQLPALSGDGNTVAFLTGAGPRPLAFTGPGLDLYVTEMDAGLTRKQATVELTRDTVGGDTATGSPLGSIALSTDGRFLAMATVRTVFALPALQLLGSPRAVPGPRELYVVDLQSRTIDRVTRAAGGGDIAADVLNGPTLSADGSRVAFAAFAGNLFFGDANQTTDAFVAERQPEQPPGDPPAPPGAGGPDSTIETDSGPQISVRARARPGGAIVLTVSVPAAGGIRAVSRGMVGEPPRRRTLATATGRARGLVRTRVELVLRPVERYRDELRERGRLKARATVEYVAARGGERARVSRQVVFERAPQASPGGRR